MNSCSFDGMQVRERIEERRIEEKERKNGREKGVGKKKTGKRKGSKWNNEVIQEVIKLSLLKLKGESSQTLETSAVRRKKVTAHDRIPPLTLGEE